jgi:hypothetical protein
MGWRGQDVSDHANKARRGAWPRQLLAGVLAIAAAWVTPARAADLIIKDGDTLIVEGITYKLDGIDSPEPDQVCLDETGAPWKCGLGCGLAPGALQITDQFGNPATWTVREASGVLWISKDRGPALLEHEGYVQIIRTFDGRIFLRPSAAQ